MHLEKLLAEADSALQRVKEELRLSKQDGSLNGEELLREVDDEFEAVSRAVADKEEHHLGTSHRKAEIPRYSGNASDYALTK